MPHCPPLAGMIHQDQPHQVGGDGKEVRPVFPILLPLPDQPEVGFVDQGGGLQSMVATFPAQVPGRLPAEFVIDEGDQLVLRPGFTVPQIDQDSGDLAWVRRHFSGGCLTQPVSLMITDN